jgi:hypothetical protein
VTGPVEVGFWYPEGNVRRGQEFELISASAALAGFELVDESEPDWVFTDPSAEPINPHDATLFAWSQTSLAVGGSDQIYACYDDPMAKGGNYNGYCDDEVTAALKELNITSDTDAQTDLLEAAETGIWADAVSIPIFQFPDGEQRQGDRGQGHAAEPRLLLELLGVGAGGRFGGVIPAASGWAGDRPPGCRHRNRTVGAEANPWHPQSCPTGTALRTQVPLSPPRSSFGAPYRCPGTDVES